ncbi:glutamic acid-rich protein-like [Chenopodium quinoa]|uniref:glutamic acid-rich protein-like n=1 Tax=Chenopodium quinoa TaxID=63459 RepID=UPI000B782DBB|nr:glutamic acid-rich protein-like [Chenopodium quinoa]
MLDHIINCYGSSHHSLPYGSVITQLLINNNVTMSGLTVPVTVFTKAILKLKGLDISGDELSFKIEEPVEEIRPPSKKKKKKKKKKVEEPVGQEVILKRLENKEDMLRKIISLVQGLSTSFTTRMEQMEKKLAETEAQMAPGIGSVPPQTQPEEEEHGEEDEEDEEEPVVDAEDDAKYEEEEEEENDDEE